MLAKIIYIFLFLFFIVEIIGVVKGLFLLKSDTEFTKHKILLSIALVLITSIQIIITFFLVDYLIKLFL
ncbi:MAG: hypothetical protein ACRC1T_18385 [Clostridium chrysemydis]|uniref:hypothetical protein n=1 Tax=Clostridium TaxID=1485 RepID=UPI0021537BC4|nr:hypothetical protein [Clostridium sp. LY3-2]MCR6513458.1 hypothetical protein [Clostridium sp. LY3-2]